LNFFCEKGYFFLNYAIVTLLDWACVTMGSWVIRNWTENVSQLCLKNCRNFPFQTVPKWNFFWWPNQFWCITILTNHFWCIFEPHFFWVSVSCKMLCKQEVNKIMPGGVTPVFLKQFHNKWSWSAGFEPTPFDFWLPTPQFWLESYRFTPILVG
jgi:hypothetical protein